MYRSTVSVGHGGGRRRTGSAARKKKRSCEEAPSSKVTVPSPAQEKCLTVEPSPQPVKMFPDLKITRKKHPQISLDKKAKAKKKPFKPKLPKKKFIRPSLSAQLGSIMSKTDDLTNTIRKLGGLELKEQALLNISSRNFVVGKLTSKFPSMVHFYIDRCTYEFFHPFEKKQVSMIMFYRHMVEVQLSSSRREFKFRIPHKLIQFPDDYNPSSQKLSIFFNSSLDVEKVRKIILPKIVMNNGSLI
mmetsp:Transcript_9978/g.16098  ORF Transcript_9978/g.16098 Transcript_9978/m.16098 type:complete len:244 (-) Transcript_9978:68-799(-)|eukprot:jgi/Bigna1/87570/estExt_fgenesh1_pg.C_220003